MRTPLGIVIDLAAWIVFLVDLIVQMRLSPGYLRRGVGIFDASIVLLTFPWYFVAGLEGALGLQVARLARLARVMVLMQGFHQKNRRRSALRGGSGECLRGHRVARRASREGFHHHLGWAVVGDRHPDHGRIWRSHPVTAVGRFAGILLMFSGIALLGILAGALASVFGLGPDPEEADPTLQELARLRSQMEELNARLAARAGGSTCDKAPDAGAPLPEVPMIPRP